MSLRISTRTLHDSIAATIGQRNARLLQLQQGLSDGRAVRTPSDDPVRAHQSMWYREQLRALEQYEKNLQNVRTVLQGTEGTLSSITDAINEVRELQVAGASDSIGADGRVSLADSLNQIIELLVSLGNDRFAGAYTFSGRGSLQPPYAAERDGAGRVTAVRMNPLIGGDVIRRVASDVSLTINVDAADLFGEDAKLFGQLIELRNALEADDGEAVRRQEAVLDQALERVMRATSFVGALEGRVEALLHRAGTDRVNYEGGRSKAEDLDVGQAVVEFQQEQVALQAALQSGARVLNLNLLDYLSI